MRFRNKSLWNTGLAKILKKNKWQPYFSQLNWTCLSEWGCCVWINEKSKQFFGAKNACVCEEPYLKWAKWVFNLNIYVDFLSSLLTNPEFRPSKCRRWSNYQLRPKGKMGTLGTRAKTVLGNSVPEEIFLKRESLATRAASTVRVFFSGLFFVIFNIY